MMRRPSQATGGHGARARSVPVTQSEEIRGLWRWIWARLNRVSQPEAEALPRRPVTLRVTVPLADAPVALCATG
jgi:hypothetical protein